MNILSLWSLSLNAFLTEEVWNDDVAVIGLEIWTAGRTRDERIEDARRVVRKDIVYIGDQMGVKISSLLDAWRMSL